MKPEIFHLQPWTPRATKVANELIAKINKIAPELEVLFMGSVALGLPGKNDIDLDILCETKHLAMYTERLSSVLGKPKKQENTSTAWEFELDGFAIDAILSDPSVSHVPKQRAVFEKLKSSADLLEEYRQLKLACNGLAYSEYESRKKAFFNDRVLANSNK